MSKIYDSIYIIEQELGEVYETAITLQKDVKDLLKKIDKTNKFNRENIRIEIEAFIMPKIESIIDRLG